MKIEYVIHADSRGGYWAEVPALPGCVTEGRTLAELRENVMDCFEALLTSYAELPPGADPSGFAPGGSRVGSFSVRMGGAPRRRAREAAMA